MPISKKASTGIACSDQLKKWIKQVKNNHLVTQNGIPSSTRLKAIKSLQLAKFRKELGQFVVEGEKAVLELLEQKQIQCMEVFCTSEWISNKRLTPHLAEKIITIAEHQMQAMSGLKTPQGILAVAQIPTYPIDFEANTQLALYLDQIQDPGNVGTILRLADWFGIKWVFASPDTADIWSPKVVQASMGAFLRVKTVRVPLSELITPKVQVLAADMDGNSIYTANIPSNGILLLGNEGQGISVSHLPLITQRITIPRHPQGGAESLNVATATAIILSNLRK
jgi:RNA methyltransferase, TrmH family